MLRNGVPDHMEGGRRGGRGWRFGHGLRLLMMRSKLYCEGEGERVG